jgi:hypothetical protein
MQLSWQKEAATSPILARVPPSQYLVPFLRAGSERPDMSFDDFLLGSFSNARQIRAPLGKNKLGIFRHLHAAKERLARHYLRLSPSERVSVVLPTRNRAEALKGALASVFTQSYPNWELIVVDDASTDGTEALMREIQHARIKYCRLYIRYGWSRARNVGLAQTTGTAIAHLDDDDEWDPDFLLVSLNAMRASGSKLLYSAQIAWSGYDRDRKLGRDFKCLLYRQFDHAALRAENYISMISCIHDSSLPIEVGGFDESLDRFVDWDFFLRATAVQTPVALPCILSHAYRGRFEDCTSLSVDGTKGVA